MSRREKVLFALGWILRDEHRYAMHLFLRDVEVGVIVRPAIVDIPHRGGATFYDSLVEGLFPLQVDILRGMLEEEVTGIVEDAILRIEFTVSVGIEIMDQSRHIGIGVACASCSISLVFTTDRGSHPLTLL